MNNNDLAALAALGAMGALYKNYLDKQGAGQGTPAAGYEDVVPSSELGSQGNFRFGNAATSAGGNANMAGAMRGNSGVGTGGIRARDVVYGGGKGGGGGGKGAAKVPFTGSGSGYDRPFPSGAAEEIPFTGSGSGYDRPFPSGVAPEESGGMGAAGVGAAGLGAAGAGAAAAYYAKVKREARLADERAKLIAETKRGILKDRTQTGVDEDRAAAARAQNEADRAARVQAQADAEAKSRATQAEIDAELRKNKVVRNDINERAAVLNKDMWAAGPTVTSETSTKKRAPVVDTTPTDMDDFNRMLRESRVGRTTSAPPSTSTSARASADTQTREDKKAAKARALLESSGTALPVPAATASTENAARLDAQKKAALKAADAQLAAVLNSKEMADSAWKQPGETDAQAAARKAKAAEVKNSAIEAHGKQVASIRAGKIGAAISLGLMGLGLGNAANAATKMDTGEREQLARDVLEGLITPLGLTPGMAGEGSDLYPSKPLSYAEKQKRKEAFLANMSPADKKKMEESLAYQNKDNFTFQDFKNFITSKKAGGGQIKAKKMASGGMTSTVSSASKRGDGIASKGKTRCKMY
jgi:hypothetical protein